MADNTNISAWDAMMGRVAGMPEIDRLRAEVERLQAALEQEQREHANCEHVNVQRFQTLTDTIIDLTQQVTAMRPMVEAVAEATHAGGNSTVAYISDLLIHQARAYLAEHPAGEAS